MKRLVCSILTLIMLFASVATLSGCDKQGNNEDTTAQAATTEESKSKKVTGNLKDAYDAVNEAEPFSDKIDKVLYKETDSDEMVCWSYGIVDMEAYDHLIDYAISMPTEYCNTFAVFVFDDSMSDEAYDQVINTVTKEYTKLRASSLQMYKPEEYQKVEWAINNEKLVWRRYDNALALIITGDSEPKTAFDAFEKTALK